MGPADQEVSSLLGVWPDAPDFRSTSVAAPLPLNFWGILPTVVSLKSRLTVIARESQRPGAKRASRP